MMKSPFLQPWGTFWMFGIVSIIAAGWMHIYVKETKYLNDKEKKTLYVPRHLAIKKHELINPMIENKTTQSGNSVVSP